MITFDEIFTHVESAVDALKKGENERALRLLEMMRGNLAAAALKETDADVGSPHYYNLIRVVMEKFPPDFDPEEYKP